MPILLRCCYELLLISICQCSVQKKPPARVSLSADHEVRLETLEHQLTRLIHDAVSLNGVQVLSIHVSLILYLVLKTQFFHMEIEL